MLAAEAKGYLLEASRSGQFLDMDESAYDEDDYDDSDDDEYPLDPKKAIANILNRHLSKNITPQKMPAPVAPPTIWKKKLEEVNTSMSQRQTYAYDAWPQGREDLQLLLS